MHRLPTQLGKSRHRGTVDIQGPGMQGCRPELSHDPRACNAGATVPTPACQKRCADVEEGGRQPLQQYPRKVLSAYAG